MSSEDRSRALAGQEAYEEEALAYENSGAAEMISACKAARVEQIRRELSDEAWAAVGDLDAARLAAVLETGVVIEKKRRVSDLKFLNIRQIFEAPEDSIVWTFFDAWVSGLESKWYGPPRPQGGSESSSEQAERVKDVQKRALDVAKLLEAKGWRMRGGNVEDHGEEAGGTFIRKERLKDVKWWSSCGHPRIKHPMLVDVLLALLGEWVSEDPDAGGLMLADWRVAVAEMAKNNSALAFQAEKLLREKTGKTLTAEGWASLFVGPTLGRDAVEARPAVEAALAEDGEMSAWSSGWLMCYAIKMNSIAMLENIARRCQKMHWRAPAEAWGWVSEEKRKLLLKKGGSAREFKPLSMLHFAIMASTPSNSSWPLISILAQSQMMSDEAKRRPSVDIFGEWTFLDVVRITAEFPFIELRDERGNSVAHVWARDIANLANNQQPYGAALKVRETLVALLSSQDAHFIIEPNAAGETAAEILASCERGEWTVEWEKAYSEWERREMDKSAEKSSASASGAGSRL